MMTDERTCPECGKRLGEGVLDGLCPECMMRVGAAAGSVPTVELSDARLEEARGAAAPPVFLPDGSTFGPYRILRRIGHGGMGVVYEAEETESGRRVALKVIREKLDAPQDRARFLREGRLAASINHPNCVYVFGTEEIEGIPAIAMEHIPGGTLERRLRHHGPQPVAETVDAVLQVLAGLEAAQRRGILHRDIKPSNCFVDDEGTVKVGDFGLSISTAPRAETLVTETGSMVGTPAFCPPEQLRGEELSDRSDMYAVGVMLYQLLTGRLPFEGRSMPQLIANALERRAPSPQRFRKEIPPGLARVILRCLEKQPADRFRSYADLRAALAHYGTTAPTPATLGLRFLAGMMDTMAWGLVVQLTIFLAVGNPFNVMEQLFANPNVMWPLILCSFSCMLLYYSLTEWRWGATLGKLICRVRVVRPDGSYPSFGRALARAACYVLIPVLPYWAVTVFSGDPLRLVDHSALNSLLGMVQFVILALLFSTARRHNGFASIYDLWTDTRIVSRAAPAKRRALAATAAEVPADEGAERIGPYHVLRPLGASDGAEWVEGYDLRLLRRVWIRRVPPGTPPWNPTLGRVTRVGRLRWLNARRGPEENWDAFEGVGGESLARLAERPQPWDQVRFWLCDLAEELAAAERDGTLPGCLAPDRVWITEEGRAKILDVSAPGIDGQTSNSADTGGRTLREPHRAGYGEAGSAVSSSQTACTVPEFLDHVAALALGGAAAPASPGIRRPLPVHARLFLDRLPGLQKADAVVAELRPALRRPARITRLRRAVALALLLFLPAVGSLAVVLGVHFSRSWERDHPDSIEAQRVLGLWQARRYPWVPKSQLPSEEEIGTYFAARLSHVIDDEAWDSGFARTMISRQARAFAEASVTNYAGVPDAERTRVEEKIRPMIEAQAKAQDEMPPAFLILLPAMILMAYIGIPAILAALLFRGGLVQWGTGVTFVRRDGRPASRLRLLWRALVAWSPVAAVMVVGAAAMATKSIGIPIVVAVSACLLACASLALPDRGLQDRLAGTWPVPR